MGYCPSGSSGIDPPHQAAYTPLAQRTISSKRFKSALYLSSQAVASLAVPKECQNNANPLNPKNLRLPFRRRPAIDGW